MKQNLRFLMLTLLCAVFSSAWGETKTGTILFGPSSGSTKIDDTSVTGDDSQGNTWTITTVGTTSFTNNNGQSFSQVGSSKKPATSITFTTTLPKEQNITAFSAQFGGFGGTAGTVTLKVGDTTVGTGSLNETNDVIVSSTQSAQGTVLTVTVTDISKGVKCYYISYTYEEGGSQPTGEKYELVNGTPSTIVEGDYVITCNSTSGKYAMSNVVENNALKGTDNFTMEESNIVTDDNTIVWHIAPQGNYWTIQSLDGGQYAANSNGGVTMTSTLDDNALWSYNGNNGFTNKANSTNLYFFSYRFSFNSSGAAVFTLYRKHVDVATPSIIPTGKSFTDELSVEITCETPGVSIYYTIDGTDPTSSSTLYEGSFTISETTTVKAIAIIADDESEIAEETFTKIPLLTIAEVRTQNVGTTVYTQGIVTSIYKQTAYIQDATAAICIYGNENLEVGQEIKVKGDLEIYHGLLEISSPIWTVVSQDNVVQPEVMTIAEVNTSTKQGWLVKIENATVQSIGSNGKDVTISQGENTILVRFNDSNDVKFFKDDVITLIGNIGCYDGVQIANPTDVEIKVDKYYVAGDWTNWADNMIEMTRNADGSYTLADQVVSNGQQFKIIKVADGTTNPIWCGGNADGDYWGINENSHSGITLNVGGGKNFKMEYAGTWTITVSFDNNDTPQLAVDGNWLSYYLVGDFNDWATSDEYKLTKDVETGNYTISKEILNEEEFKILKLIGSEKTWFGTVSDGAYWFEEKDCDKEISLVQSGKNILMKLSNLVAWDIVFDPANMKLVLSNYVSDYATLTFTFNGGINDIVSTSGLTQSGLGSDYAQSTNPNTILKFDNTGDNLVLKFKERPGVLSFYIKGNGFSNSTFTVQTSEDGNTYTDLQNYQSISNSTDGQHEVFDELDENVRYIKWIYTEKSSGNVGLGNIKLTKYVEPFEFSINELASDGTDCYATISALGDGNWKVSGDVEVSTVIVNSEGKLEYPVKAQAGDVIPGDGAYLVKGAAGTYTFNATGKVATITIGEDDNMLLSTGEGNITTNAPTGEADNGNYNFYKLSRNKNGAANSVGFYWGNSTGSAFTYTKGHQAYLAVPKENAQNVQGFSFDETTGIAEVETITNGINEVYTISGIRIDGSNLGKGVYIVNGKKVIIK